MSNERVCVCCRRIIPMQNFVKVLKSGDRAHYGGLVTCASVWICPVCAAKISERKRADLVKGIAFWKDQGGEVLMLTQTVPHYLHEPLQVVLSGFMPARRLLRHRKPWKRISKRIGLAGTVRALEVTYGENGWHVHAHELLFRRPGLPVDIEDLQSALLGEWQQACLDAGRPEPNEHGIKVDDGSKAAKYASKWGMEDEVTKAHLKKGKEGHWSPWDFLRQVDQGNMTGVSLFAEYARAFKGRHQLEWSNGLRQLLGLGAEASDEEIAAQQEEGAILLGLLTRENWRVVLHANKRGELLEVAAASGWDGVLNFIATLTGRKTDEVLGMR